jgi:hypothetical protein
MKAPKRQPLLSDMLLQQTRSPYDPPRQSMLTAKRFDFDVPASEFVGKLLNKTARLILREQEFARQPYPQTWVELDASAYSAGLMGAVEGNPETADTKFGFLYDRGTVHGGTVYCGAASKWGCNWSPFKIMLHKPMSFEDEMALATQTGHSRLTLRQALIGYAEHMHDPWWHSDEAKSLVRSHTYVPAPGLSMEQNRGILQQHQGVLKQVLAMLLILTRPGRRVLTITDEGHQRMIWKGKSIVLAKHSVVRLHIDQSVAIRRFISGVHTGLHRRLHDVRGHWAQTRRHQNACTHVWDPVDVDHYRCLRCEAKRWWRKNHSRGLPEVGTIVKEYEVSK